MAISLLLLTPSGQEWQLADVLLDLLADLPHQMHHGIHIIQCIWQQCWIPQEKVGISCHLWIIRVENSQLALYSHVICNPSSTLPQNMPETPTQMTITNFNYEGSYGPGLICNIVVKANLGRSPGRSIPKGIMGYILWDVFGIHFGFFKKRWEFPFISE